MEYTSFYDEPLEVAVARAFTECADGDLLSLKLKKRDGDKYVYMVRSESTRYTIVAIPNCCGVSVTVLSSKSHKSSTIRRRK